MTLIDRVSYGGISFEIFVVKVILEVQGIEF
jgi:hypothetical protein